MDSYTIINIPEGLKYYGEIKNEITHYLDRFNLTFPKDEDYRDVHRTYISLFNNEIAELIDEVGTHDLSFRIVGATRGAIFINEISREMNTIDDHIQYTIVYEIKNIEFFEDVCFGTLKAYKREVIEKSNKKFRGNKLIMNIKI